MNRDNTKIGVLLAEIRKAVGLVDELHAEYREFIDTDLLQLGRKRITAVYLAEILEDTYTCLETLFLRISQFFENSLSSERWHQDLLEKMRLDITGIRKAVISDSTFLLLYELLRFRHFKRYYFSMDYDWDKLEFLTRTYVRLIPAIHGDLADFESFLQALDSDLP